MRKNYRSIINALYNMNNKDMQTKRNRVLIVLVALNTALLVASNTAGAKMISVTGGLVASATVFSYAFTFLLTDLISELYGKETANFAVRIGFFSLFITVVFFVIAINAPAASFWHGQEAYEATLGLGPRILAGGWLAYIISQHLDVWIFHKIRSITGERHMWLRNNASTVISQFLDSCIFITVAFYGIFPIFEAILGQYLLKVVIAIIDTPIFYVAKRFIKRISTE